MGVDLAYNEMIDVEHFGKALSRNIPLYRAIKPLKIIVPDGFESISTPAVEHGAVKKGWHGT